MKSTCTALCLVMLICVSLCFAQEDGNVAGDAAVPNSVGASSGAPALGGGGTKNYVPVWLSSSKLGNSKLFQTAGNVGVGTTTPGATLDVNGTINASTSFNLGGNAFAFGSYSNSNVFLGFAGGATTLGYYNTASGTQALHSNTTGNYNTAYGYQALFSNTQPCCNTAIGTQALYSNTQGTNSTAIGIEALYYNTTGYSNTATGGVALSSNTTGNYNTADGQSALINNTTGGNNTAIGQSALINNMRGSFNTALGYLAGPDYNSPNLTNATAIGANATVSESNALVLGGTDAYAVKVGIGTATPANVFTIAQGAGVAISDGWNTYSSRRWKTNIQTLQGALGKVGQLRGVSYDLKANGRHEVGVIAEEVGVVVPEVVTWDEDGKDAQSVDYGRLTALLIEATKEQQALIHKQQEQIKVQQMQIQAQRQRGDAQQAQIARLTQQVKTIQTSIKANGRSSSEVRTVKAEGTGARK